MHYIPVFVLCITSHLIASCGQVAEVFTGTPGKYVPLENTIKDFKGVLEGKYDDLPEMAFYMVGDITEVQEKADKMAKEIAARKVCGVCLGPDRYNSA